MKITKKNAILIQEYQNSLKPQDDGAQGKTYEVVIRTLLQPHNKIFKSKLKGQNDLLMLDKRLNKRIRIEIKSGGGCLLYDTSINRDNMQLSRLIEEVEAQYDYIIYSLNADIEEARVYSVKEFITLLSEYPRGIKSMLAFRTSQQALYLTNVFSSKVKTNFMKEMQKKGYSLADFKQLIHKKK